MAPKARMSVGPKVALLKDLEPTGDTGQEGERDEMPEEQGAVEVVVPSEHQTGVYANLGVISSQTEHDFTLDFCQVVPGEEKPLAVVVARLKLAPSFLMPLMRTLSDHLAQYEDAMKQVKGEDDTEEETDQ